MAQACEPGCIRPCLPALFAGQLGLSAWLRPATLKLFFEQTPESLNPHGHVDRRTDSQVRLIAAAHIGRPATALTFSAPLRPRWSERAVICGFLCDFALRMADG